MNLRFILLVALVALSQRTVAQNFHLQLDTLELDAFSGLQSFAWGTSDGKWLLIGGRTDGLHRRQPFASFLAEGNNTSLVVIDPVSGQTWFAGTSDLPVELQEQLQSTNMAFYQSGDVLYIAGGYGYSASADDHITYPYLTAVDVGPAIGAIIAGTSPADYFRYVEDDRMANTGGQLGKIGSLFYLVGGQRFTGRYNPMNGPSFVQEYSSQIRSFSVADDGNTLLIGDYNAVTDEVELHRRDYNLCATYHTGGEFGYTMFSGVFQPDSEIPFLNVVDISSDSYEVINDFSQRLNQYHSAHMEVYAGESDQMTTVFFGGIAQFHYDQNGFLVEDINVPFVDHISGVVRNADGLRTEVVFDEKMPALLGAGAEFIPAAGLPVLDDGIIDIDDLEADSVLAGFIVGGIESSLPNIFWDNTGSESWTNPIVYRVWLIRDEAVSVQPVVAPAFAEFTQPVLFPNPVHDTCTFGFYLENPAQITIYIQDLSGKLVMTAVTAILGNGDKLVELDVSGLAAGMYTATLSTGKTWSSVLLKKE